MGQAVFTTGAAIAIAVVLTAMVAAVTSAAETSSRAINLAVASVLLALALVEFQRAELRINFTGSMPIGIYRLAPVPRDGIKRGMLVAVCAPADAVAVGLGRAYLARGPCAGYSELLLKSIAAVPSDEVDVTAAGVMVDRCLLSHSRPIARDQSGRKLVPWPPGYYRLAQHRVWLYASNDRSWDSRYWGPVSLTDIQAEAVPLLVTAGVFRHVQHRPECSALLPDT